MMEQEGSGREFSGPKGQKTWKKYFLHSVTYVFNNDSILSLAMLECPFFVKQTIEKGGLRNFYEKGISLSQIWIDLCPSTTIVYFVNKW